MRTAQQKAQERLTELIPQLLSLIDEVEQCAGPAPAETLARLASLVASVDAVRRVAASQPGTSHPPARTPAIDQPGTSQPPAWKGFWTPAHQQATSRNTTSQPAAGRSQTTEEMRTPVTRCHTTSRTVTPCHTASAARCRSVTGDPPEAMSIGELDDEFVVGPYSPLDVISMDMRRERESRDGRSRVVRRSFESRSKVVRESFDSLFIGDLDEEWALSDMLLEAAGRVGEP